MSRNPAAMNAPSVPSAVSSPGIVRRNEPVSRGLIRLEVELPQSGQFEPGQFAMFNLAGPQAFVFARPFSILAMKENLISFLYRIVGRGTRAMGVLAPGAQVTVLGPLGRPFPVPTAGRSVVAVAGGVGLPPVAAWFDRYGRPSDRAFFGGRDGHDVPWNLLDESWGVSVDDEAGLPAGSAAHHGVITELVALRCADLPAETDLLACGPTPLLKAAATLAEARGWRAWLSLEEHMGCGYGVCKGCVVKVRDRGQDAGGVKNATCCQDGPVFAAEDLVWPDSETVAAGGGCHEPA